MPKCPKSIAEKALGPERPDIATSLNNLAAPCQIQGHYADAEPPYKRFPPIWERTLGPDEHPHEITILENYAALLRQTARADEAARMEARAEEIRANSE